MLVKYMQIQPDKITNGFGQHRLILATVDAVWCCAVGCFTTEDLLLEKEGVFLLIDLLQVCEVYYYIGLNCFLGCSTIFQVIPL